MRLSTVLLLFLLPPVSAFAVTLKSQQLDAFVQRDGSVRLDYIFEIFNGSNDPYGSFSLSLPTSTYDVAKIRAYRCDAPSSLQAEAGAAQLEQEGTAGRPLTVAAEGSKDLFDLVVNLRDEPLMPGETGRVCVIVPLDNFVQEDWECAKTAYVSVRPSIFFSDPDDGELFVAIHLPEGVDPRMVLGQQEWPQEEIQYWIPVLEESGHPVVRWSARKSVHGLYWIAAFFPADSIPLKPKFDGLQTDIRVIPKELVTADVYIQEDGLVKVVYEMEIDNSGGCRSVDSVQFVLTGKPRSVSATQDGSEISIGPYPDIIDRLESHLGTSWYQPYNASLKTPIYSGKTGSIRVEALLEEEVELKDGSQETVMVAFGLTASATGYWQPGSRWTTRIHLPPGVTPTEINPQSPDAPLKEVVDGRTAFLWEHTKAPEEVRVVFPVGNMKSVNWSAKEATHWVFVLKRIRNYPNLQKALGAIGLFFFLVVAVKVVKSFGRDH